MTTAYAAKWAIYDALHRQGQRGGQLFGLGTHGGALQVKEDNSTGDMEAICVYPGGVQWDRIPERTLEDGGTPEHPEWLVAEEDTSTWFVRVDYGGDEFTPKQAELRAVDVIDAIGRVVATNRALAGPGSKSYIVGGTGGYFPASPGHRVVVAMVAIRTQTNYTE
jgi:hypothetical protein